MWPLMRKSILIHHKSANQRDAIFAFVLQNSQSLEPVPCEVRFLLTLLLLSS